MIRKNIKSLNIHYIIFSIYIVLFLYLHSFIHLGADDFYYSTFWSQGFKGFINNNIEHYINLTGRTFVHLLCESTQTLGSNFFAFTNSLFIGLLVYLSSKIANLELKASYHKYSLLIVLFLFSSTSVMILRESVFWVSGSFNYLFPVLLQISLFYLLYNDIKDQNAKKSLLILSFFAGATVEQTGILSIFTITFLICLYIYENKKFPKLIYLFHWILSLSAYLTLFLSPGVLKRFSYHQEFSSLPLLAKVETNIDIVVSMIIAKEGLAILLFILLIATSIFIYIKSNKKYLSILVSFSALLILLIYFDYLTSQNIITLIAILVATTLFFSSIYLLIKKEYISGYFIIIGLATLGVMLISPVLGMRMIFAARIFFILSFSRLAILITSSNRFEKNSINIKYILTSVVIILFATSSINTLHLIEGYKSNSYILDENLNRTLSFSQSNEKDLQLLSMHDEYYGYENIPINGNFTNSYIKLHNLAKDTIISSYDSSERSIFINGQAIDAKSYTRSGIIYLPLRSFFEALDYKVTWENSLAKAKNDDYIYAFKSGQSRIITTDRSTDTTNINKIDHPIRSISSSTYIPIDILNMFSNIEYSSDESKLQIIFTEK